MFSSPTQSIARVKVGFHLRRAITFGRPPSCRRYNVDLRFAEVFEPGLHTLVAVWRNLNRKVMKNLRPDLDVLVGLSS
jgi:hypothetical protein